MCFSATASFTASGVLSGTAFFTLRNLRSKSQLLFALYPLLFAIHQFAEGIVWVTLSSGNYGTLNLIATTVYLLFSHMIALTYFPLSIYLMEKSPRRKTIMFGFVIAGVALSLCALTIIFILHGFSSQISSCGHIDYVSYTFSSDYLVRYNSLLKYIYITVVCANFFIASDKRLMIMGALFGSGFVISYQWFTNTFQSVWCFFAAIISMLVYVYIRFPKKNSNHSRQ